MQVVNLLKFLNNVHDIYTLDFSECSSGLINLLDLMNEDEQFTKSINLGLIYVNQKTFDQYIIIDGLRRFVSLTLLLHAICECYKKTTKRNEKAIRTIREKYIFSKNEHFKIHLQEKDADIMSKIINGERLSGNEKSNPMFVLLHNIWTQIKKNKLQASKIFKVLQKINITLVETDEVPKRDLYIQLNKEKREINQLSLINSYIEEIQLTNEWNSVKSIFQNKANDINAFIIDFFVTKFGYKKYNPDKIYENFVNYFETMQKYASKDNIINSIKSSARLYFNIINLNFDDTEIKKAFINIKRHNGEDTFAYILNLYEDYVSENISKSIFIEILNTIDEYLKNREKSGKNIDFNELVQYLDAFITFK